MSSTDSELMDAAKGGDIRSFDELVGLYADRIYSFALRLSGNPSTADDAAQETFIKVWKNRKRYDPRRDFKPWIFAIARNAVFDIMRKKRDQTFSSLNAADDDETIGDRIVDEAIAAAESFDRRLLKEALEETLLTLGPNQRAAVLLHDVEGMTFDEAGKAMGKPLNTVKSHYRRAIIELRKKLVKKGYREP